MSALPIETISVQKQRPLYQSDILFCEEELPYWLSLYKANVLYSTTGQVSYEQAYKHALLWISIKNAGRHYKILHEKEGFHIEEESHIVTQRCQHPGCRFFSRHSLYVIDGEVLRAERMKHLASHQRPLASPFLKIILAVIFCLTLILGCWRCL